MPIASPIMPASASTMASVRAARLARREAAKEYARLHLQQDFPEAQRWRSLIALYGLQTPHWYVPGTDVRVLNRAARKLSLSPSERYRITGCRSFKEYQAQHDGWPAWALLGLLLERLSQQPLIGTNG